MQRIDPDHLGAEIGRRPTNQDLEIRKVSDTPIALRTERVDLRPQSPDSSTISKGLGRKASHRSNNEKSVSLDIGGADGRANHQIIVAKRKVGGDVEMEPDMTGFLDAS